MGFSPRVYELHLFLQDEDGDWNWEQEGAYATLDQANTWFNRYKDAGAEARIIETKIVKAYEDGKLYT